MIRGAVVGAAVESGLLAEGVGGRHIKVDILVPVAAQVGEQYFGSTVGADQVLSHDTGGPCGKTGLGLRKSRWKFSEGQKYLAGFYSAITEVVVCR